MKLWHLQWNCQTNVVTLLSLDPRRESQWKTVHTVFFGENDYSHDESLSKAGPQEFASCDDDRRNRAGNGDASSNLMNIPFKAMEEKVSEKPSLDMEKTQMHATSDSEDEDRMATDLSDAGEDIGAQKTHVPLEKTIPGDEEGEKLIEEMMSSREKFEVSSRRGESHNFESCNQEGPLDCPAEPASVEKTSKPDLIVDSEIKRISTLGIPKSSPDTDLIKDNDGDGDNYDFQTRKHLLTERFHILASNRKVTKI